MDDEQRNTGKRPRREVTPLDPDYVLWLEQHDVLFRVLSRERRLMTRFIARANPTAVSASLFKRFLFWYAQTGERGLTDMLRVLALSRRKARQNAKSRREAEWVLRLAEVMFGRARRERVFDPLVSDMRLEIDAARTDGRVAVLFARVRGWSAIIQASGLVAVFRLLLRGWALVRLIV